MTVPYIVFFDSIITILNDYIKKNKDQILSDNENTIIHIKKLVSPIYKKLAQEVKLNHILSESNLNALNPELLPKCAQPSKEDPEQTFLIISEIYEKNKSYLKNIDSRNFEEFYNDLNRNIDTEYNKIMELSPISNLPEEIWGEIFSFSKIEDIKKNSLVFPKACSAINSNLFWVKRLEADFEIDFNQNKEFTAKDIYRKELYKKKHTSYWTFVSRQDNFAEENAIFNTLTQSKDFWFSQMFEKYNEVVIFGSLKNLLEVYTNKINSSEDSNAKQKIINEVSKNLIILEISLSRLQLENCLIERNRNEIYSRIEKVGNIGLRESGEIYFNGKPVEKSFLNNDLQKKSQMESELTMEILKEGNEEFCILR